MPIKGGIEADYSKFEGECEKAAVALGKIEQQGKATETSLVSMEQSVSTGAISKSIEKTVQSVDKVATSSKVASTQAGQLADGFRTADKVLNQFGVNLGPTIGSLDEMARVSTQTVGTLGKLGTAVSVAGVALASWNIGRWIADLTGADAAIADFASTLTGRGSVAAETYGAKLDAIQRAIRNGYEGIPTYTQAIEFNAKAAQRSSDAHLSAAGRMQEWEREIAKARGGAGLLRAEVAAGVLTTDELTRKFEVSAGAVGYLKKQLDATTDAIRAKERADEDAAKKAQQHADAIAKLRASMFGTDAIEKATQYQAALGSTENLTRLTRDAQASLNATLGDAIAAYQRAGDVAPQAMRNLYIETIQLPPVVAGLGHEFANVGAKVTITAESVVKDLGRMRAEVAAYERETQAMVDEYVRMQYGAQGATGAIRETTGAQQQLTVALQDFGNVAMSAYEKAISGAQLFQAYAAAGIPTSGSIGLGGYEFKQLQQTGVPGGLSGMQWSTAQPSSAQPWGNTLTVNVNSTDASNIADKLVTEMRHSGIRF
jgi:hypothetical protein